MSTFPRFTLDYFCTVFHLKDIHESESKLVVRLDGTLKDRVDRRRPWSHFLFFSLVFARTSRGNRNRINNTRRIFEIHTAHRGVSSEVEGGFGDTIIIECGNIQVAASTIQTRKHISPNQSHHATEICRSLHSLRVGWRNMYELPWFFRESSVSWYLLCYSRNWIRFSKNFWFTIHS